MVLYIERTKKMRNKKGFTLVEVMIVVLTVAILASILIPMLGARVESAKWAEGKAGAGTIATALRTYAAENGNDGKYSTLTVAQLFKPSDLLGRYFDIGDYHIEGTVSYDESRADYPLHYTITVDRAESDWTVIGYTLDHEGNWDEVAATP